MRAYNYDQSGWYTGESEAKRNPFYGVTPHASEFLLPANATDKLPPVPDPGETWPRFAAGEWELQESHKGRFIWVGNARIKCSYHGVLQAGHSLTPPAEITRAEFKKQRTAAVAALTVTVDGMVFDANEQAQARMLGAIQAAAFRDASIPFWVLADNSVIQNVPVVTLQQAHAEALRAMSALWLPGA